jgi:hypothetical protein
MIDSRDILKSFFQIGDVPTDVQFADLIDSYVHKTDDGVTVYDLTDPAPDPNNPAKRFGVGVTIPESRLSVLADKLNGNMISFHSLPSPAVADWVLNLAPGANPGFSINQSVAGGDKRFFIQNGSGFVGIGTKTPGQLLHLEGLKGDSPLGLQLRNLAATSNRGFIMGHNIGTDAEPSQNGHLTFLEVLADGSKQERFTISNGGKVGVGIYNPDTLMHAFGSYNAPLTRIALAPNRGILEVGQVEKYNLLFDTRGIQARDADTPDPTKPNEIVVKFSDLSIQPLGGDISFHDQLTAPADQEKKAILTRDGRFGVGLTNPQERMDLNGAIRIGEAVNSNPGTIRYSNASGAYDIEGFVDGSWQSLTGNGSSAWAAVAGGINYGGGNVGIGGLDANVKLSVGGGVKIGDNSTAVAGTIRYSNATSGIYTFEGCVQGTWVNLAGGGGSDHWVDGPGNIHFEDGDVGIGTPTTNSLLHVLQRQIQPDKSSATLIQNDAPGDAAFNKRVGLEISNTTAWGGGTTSFDIGLYVSRIMGQPGQTDHTLAALMNGNVVIGDMNGDARLVGVGGKNVLTVGKGTPPTTKSDIGIQIFVDRPGGGAVYDTFNLINGNGDLIKLFKGAALTPANNTTPIPENWLLAITIVDNMRTRINQLEARLQALGLL